MLNFDEIPKELQNLNQWVCYRLKDDNKEPFIPGTDFNASNKNPKHWKSYQVAIKACDNGKYDGISFAIGKPYCAIDLDDCIDSNTGEIHSKALEIIRLFDTYTEISVSGCGIHIIFKAKLPEHKTLVKTLEFFKIEVFDLHFISPTGNLFENRNIIQDRQLVLDKFILDYDLITKLTTTAPGTGASTSALSDSEVIEKASKAYYENDVFNRLYFQGDISLYYNDDSIADYHLAKLLAYWTQKDMDQIEHIMRMSALQRDKWNTHKTYLRELTIQKAINNTTKVYNPGGYHKELHKFNKEGDPVVEENSLQIEPSVIVNQESDKPVKYFNLTDYGNAERLVYYHGENIRYCEPMKSWFIWDGKRWKPDDSLAIDRLAKDTVRQIHKEADLFRGLSDDKYKEKSKEIFSHAGKSESNNRIQAMVALARSESGVIIRPDSLDRNGFLLNCENGTIDLRIGELLPHRKEDNITKIIPVSYDRKAEYPKWERFLNEIFSCDQELIRFIKYSVGYSLTNSINEQCFFICYGTGANGKSVFLDTIEYILGEYGRRVNPITFEDIYKNSGPREDIAGLKQIRYISTIETAQGRRLAENLLKQMTGDSTIRARFLYQNSFEFEQTYKIWIATNHKPGIRGTDEGIWRRVRLIPFEFTIEPEKQNKNLRDELREEAPGILQWAVEGCITWLGTGLHCVTPQKVKSATDTYRQEMDTIRAFIAECCVLGYDKQVKVTDLHNAYLEWSGDRISRKEFNRKIEDLGYKKEKLPAGIFWIGVGLYNEQTII